ncbi:hypothetical protein [Phocaeicola salanitronis]|uniref:hypothetical protein n=1 Tax=Phocaeicola salanitronis TaxID=376805 RepID=UPI0025A3FDB2|nr:hypothetical protein [Phocaeicola salanitronis]MDM8306590.1 hypothetical protein [Phocaeicola salanitronis]
MGRRLYLLFFVMIAVSACLFGLTFGTTWFREVEFPFGTFSTDMGDWGDFATCMTGVFAFISVLLAFEAFKGQVLALKRNSFDTLFSQLFAHHIKLYEKIQDAHVSEEENIFLYYCREIKESIIDKNGLNELWRSYIDINKGDKVKYENLKNYFKYIYHEIDIIREYEKEGILTRAMAKKYVLLIQAQMNNYELLCYLLNQLEYYYFGKKGKVNKERQEKYYKYLKRNDFFKDLNDSRSFVREVEILLKAAHLGDKAPL